MNNASHWYGSVGVIVARFQGPRLHKGWQYLIDYVRSRHERVLLFLGDHGGLRTKDDPLTFREREVMVLQTYTYNTWLTVKKLVDHPHSHQLWTRNLDQLIAETFPGASVTMYGSRDSFIPLYRQAKGRYQTHELEPLGNDSGTEERKRSLFSNTEEGRAAIICAERDRPSIAYSTVDIGIINRRKNEVLLITKKAFDNLWAFPGGFLDPELDEDDEAAARRERSEELRGIRVGSFTQLGNRIKVDDPRYRRSSDKIFTTLFETPYLGGVPRPADDAELAKWFPVSELGNVLIPWHQKQGRRLQEHIQMQKLVA